MKIFETLSDNISYWEIIYEKDAQMTRKNRDGLGRQCLFVGFGTVFYGQTSGQFAPDVYMKNAGLSHNL